MAGLGGDGDPDHCRGDPEKGAWLASGCGRRRSGQGADDGSRQGIAPVHPPKTLAEG